jgi:hypothetical protein
LASEQRSRHALQGQCRPPSPHSRAAVPGDELGSVRRQPASAGKSDRLVLCGSHCRLAGRAAHNPGRSSSLFGFGDQNGVDVAGGVPIGAASDRGLDRLDPPTSGSGSGGARSLNPEPAGRNPGGAKALFELKRTCSPAGRQHRPAFVRTRRVVDREARHPEAPVLAKAAHRRRRRDWKNPRISADAP